MRTCLPRSPKGSSFARIKSMRWEIPRHRPARASDEEVVQWCIDRRAVLITLDRGRKNPEMLELIRARNVRVILAPRGTSARDIVRLFALRHDRIEDDARRGRACRYRLGPGGRLSPL